MDTVNIMKYSVLFFDSGIGGLSVCQETLKQNHNIIPLYLFDNLHFPYGIQPDDVVINTVVELIAKFTSRIHVDLVVIACNTASTVALEQVRKAVDIPIVGVVPAIKPASAITKNGVIGLLATPATIRRKYTMDLIANFASDKTVLKIGTSELVEIAERKMIGLPYDEQIISHVLHEWVEGDVRPDTVILGCTHFPHLRSEIQKVLPSVTLVDSGDAIARRVKFLLTELANNHISTDTSVAETESTAYCTDVRKLNSDLISGFKKFGFCELKLFE
ncbi:glutamate racemase [Ruminobacter sp. RM87]|jgi:glutamate racemase|uniref:glutamate racemase n=1 Tax=Ruminobacter sp. RM87 TaxID=1200567 RepID=UPI000AD17BC2|nr:glutamate racemase [Ruminobacter sp. RM87]